MDRTSQIIFQLESMIDAGEIDEDIVDEITSIVKELKVGKRALNEFYRASTPKKLLNIFAIANQRVFQKE